MEWKREAGRTRTVELQTKTVEEMKTEEGRPFSELRSSILYGYRQYYYFHDKV